MNNEHIKPSEPVKDELFLIISNCIRSEEYSNRAIQLLEAERRRAVNEIAMWKERAEMLQRDVLDACHNTGALSYEIERLKKLIGKALD